MKVYYTTPHPTFRDIRRNIDTNKIEYNRPVTVCLEGEWDGKQAIFIKPWDGLQLVVRKYEWLLTEIVDRDGRAEEELALFLSPKRVAKIVKLMKKK